VSMQQQLASRHPARYLDELIDYGGEPHTRAEAILHMQSIGATQPMIDRWLQGYEYAQRRREQKRAINLKTYLHQ